MLRDAGLVTVRPEGTRRLYRVDLDGLAGLRAWVDGFWDDALAAFVAHAEGEARPMTPHHGIRPPVLRSAHVARPLDETFAVFTRQIGAWWPLPTHGIFGADAGGLGFEDGLLVERAVDGRTSVWGEVLAWDPPHRLVVTWHPGRRRTRRPRSRCASRHPTAAARASSSSTAAGSGSARARCVAATATSGPAPGGTCSTTSPTVADPRPDAVDLTAVAAAYDAFFAEAERGGFGEPPPGEWDAARVLAHVALNDLAMTAVAQALVHGRTDLAFGNVTCQDPQVLTDWVAATGDLTALVARGRELARGRRWRPRPGSTPTSSPRRCPAGCSTTAELVLDDADAVGSPGARRPGQRAPAGAHRPAARPQALTGSAAPTGGRPGRSRETRQLRHRDQGQQRPERREARR